MQITGSEVDSMMISTDKWRMNQQELASLRAANARLVTEKSVLLECIKFGRDAAKSAVGNLIAFDAKVKHLFDNVIK